MLSDFPKRCFRCRTQSDRLRQRSDAHKGAIEIEENENAFGSANSPVDFFPGFEQMRSPAMRPDH
jgi:hypothetical protein